jgi:hypothetical protein
LVLIDQAARRATLKVATRLRSITCRNVSSGSGPSFVIVRTDTPPPAVFTTASTPPRTSIAWASACSVPSKSVTSHSTYDPLSALATSAPALPGRSSTATFPPPATTRSAVAFAMPDAPPTATRRSPCSSMLDPPLADGLW